MKKKQFFVELKNEINLEDFSNLRLLYSPIIGSKSIMLFQIFFDLYILNKHNNSFYFLSEIQKILGMSELEIQKERMKLEAVGLIRTFEKADNVTFIFKLNKPLSPHNFKKNSILFKNLVAKIGEIIFERIEFSKKTRETQKDEYNEITTKYQDLFEINNIDNFTQNTLELSLPTIKSKEEAISGLTFAQFVLYLTGSKISPSQLHIFQSLSNQGFSSKSLNLIIDYSFIKNNKIVANYIKKIAEDLLSKEIKDAHSVELELKNALESNSSKLKNDPVFKEDKQHSDDNWNELIDSIGGL